MLRGLCQYAEQFRVMRKPFAHTRRVFMNYGRCHIFPARLLATIVIASVFLSFSATSLHAAEPVPRILVINSYSPGYDWSDDEIAGVRSTLGKSFPRVELFIEHLDTKKFSGKKHFPAEAGLLEAKYAGQHLDVVIAMDNAALEFAVQYRHRFSPGTPLVFCGVNDYKPSMIAGQARITGVAEYHDFAGTLGLALQLHPATRSVTVIHDFTDTGWATRRELERIARSYPGVTLRFMDEVPLEEMLRRLGNLSPGNLVLMLSYTVEKGGRTFTHSEAARLVSSASPVPVYSVYAAQLGHGVVGGRMMEGQIQGQRAAELAARIIDGESPEKLPVITSSSPRPMFDYQVIEKYGIDPARLPSDAILINKPSTTFAINKTAVWSVGLFTLFCAISLMVLALNIRKRKQLEEMLRLKIEQYQETQEELEATEEMLRAQVDDYMQSQDELQATEEMLRSRIVDYQTTHDQLLATEEMLRVQLERVEESSKKYEAVFEHSPIAVVLTGLTDGIYCEVNQAFIDMFGYSREETIGRTTAEQRVWLCEADRDGYLQRLRNNGFVHGFESEMRRKDGEKIAVLISSELVEIASKEYVLGAVIELTELKRLQSQLLQSQKMDVVGQLAGGIAHDFNNMLAGIMAAAEVLKRRLQSDEKNSKLVDTIIKASARSADLTRELLTFSRKGTAVSGMVHIHDTIAAVIDLLERTIDKGIHLSAQLAEGNPVVAGDQTQLQNALLNLGINARDAMPQGGELTYTTAIRNLDASACRSFGLTLVPGCYLEIVVSDTGIGMTEAVMSRIFEPFFTTKEVGKGTGLGLAAVYGTVRSHHGEVCVRSEPGAGSVFSLYLPLIEYTAVQSVCADEVAHGKGGVLLVDDEEILRDVGRDLLEGLGYSVFLAENGVEALEQFAAHRSDILVILLDINMPKLGGRETFLRLREMDPDVKVLFCSGLNSAGTGDELMQLGARGFIQKPFSRNELGRAVAGAV